LPAADPGAPLASISGDPRRSDHVALTVFYNGDCPVCRHYVARFQAASAGRSPLIAWCDAAAAPWALRRWRVEPTALLVRLHLVDADGRLLAGVVALARLWRELPGYRWLGRLLALPGVTPVAECLYRALYVRPLQRRLCGDPGRGRWAGSRAN